MKILLHYMIIIFYRQITLVNYSAKSQNLMEIYEMWQKSRNLGRFFFHLTINYPWLS